VNLKCLGPYKILAVISPWTYKLQLPKDIHIHPVQPITHLSKPAENPFPAQDIEPPPIVILEGEEEYEVGHIENSRLFRCQFQYLVKWKGYDKRSWKPVGNIYVLQAINIYQSEQPAKPGSKTS
jgi:hypothetical protein